MSISDLLRRTRKRFGKPRFAALRYGDTTNLGDEIQTIAVLRFLPRVDMWADREELDRFTANRKHKIILSGWFMHQPERWPPSKLLDPLIISFHLTNEIFGRYNKNGISPSATVLGARGIEYLKRYEPIGARDLHTLQQLRDAGVEAYFSGCLTLTLALDNTPPRGDDVYAVNVSEEVIASLARGYRGPVTALTHVTPVGADDKMQQAEALLRKYASAHCIVTSRLHCALPCLALGTPVLFIESARDRYRFDGLRDLLHTTSESGFLSNEASFDPNDPSPNGTGWREYRDRLIANCEEFVRR